MSYQNFLVSLAVLWIAYWGFQISNYFETMHQLKVVTLQNVSIGRAGGSGLIKHYYFKEKSTQFTLQNNSSDIDRIYGGLTLSKFLLPMREINEQGSSTIYALTSPLSPKMTHFAATPGNTRASSLRLAMDVISYLTEKYLLLGTGLMLLFATLPKIYAFLYKSKDVSSEITASSHGIPSMILWCLFSLWALTSFI